jgi:5-formyltetrahydrofolate cyclo-ligase
MRNVPHGVYKDHGSRRTGRTQLDQELKSWRKDMRAQLIAARMAVPLDARTEAAAAIAGRLAELVKPGQVFSFYWPMKGELDFRLLAARLYAQGVTPALPVVVEKQQPMVFRPWAPKAAMRRGIWNIPEPATDQTVMPDFTLAPVVGFSADGYRLGYGGGYFDRTLAVLAPPPLAIGVGLDIQRIDTIRPMPHDIRLDAIMTETATYGQPARP